MLDKSTIELTNDQPFELHNPEASPDFLIVCDHASNALPEGYGTLGLAATEFHRHIAYDIGCAEVTRQLSDRFNCPAVLGRYSRLLVDLNRGTDDPTIVMKLSDGSIIPDNHDVDAFQNSDEFFGRIQRYHAPYHDAVAAQLARARAMDIVPIVFSIHSYTPAWRGQQRRWHTGILWDKDPRLAVPLMEALGREPGMVVGDNEPYGGFLKGDTLYRHCTQAGFPHALIEIRQDLIDTADGQAEWVERLTRLLPDLIARDGMREVVHYGSRSDR